MTLLYQVNGLRQTCPPTSVCANGWAVLICVAAFLLLPAGSGLAATYYVATTGSDSNAGTQSRPFLTLDKAFQVVQPGDVVIVQPGAYAGNASTRRDGTSSARITVRGLGETSTLSGQLSVDHDYYVLESLNLRTLRMGNGVPGGNHTIVRSNLIGGHFYPARVWSNHNIFTANTFSNLVPVGSGVTLLELTGGAVGNLIASNLFTANNGHDVIRPFGRNHVISNNRFLDITSGPQAGHDGHADIVQVFALSANFTSTNIVFERNLIKNSNAQLGNLEQGGTGVLYKDAQMGGWSFRNNLFINSRIQINNYLRDVSFYNNTVLGKESSSTGLRFASSSTKGTAHNGRVFNNLFLRMGGNKSATGVFDVEGSVTNCLAGHNIITDWDDSAKSTMSVDATSINGGVSPDDLFMDWEEGDFRLRPDSPAVLRGLNFSDVYREDFAGRTRPLTGPWSIGAFEFNAADTVGNGVDVWLEPEIGVVDAPFVVSAGYVSQLATTSLGAAGRIALKFNVTTAGDYAVILRVDAPNESSNSLYFNLNAEPVDPQMVWDIPVTAGFQNRVGAWRGNATFDQSQFAPKYFTLTPGQHELIIRGREANVRIERVKIHKRPSPTSGVGLMVQQAP